MTLPLGHMAYGRKDAGQTTFIYFDQTDGEGAATGLGHSRIKPVLSCRY
jgi:hypothetical protein